jgi:hypothetical protein
LSVAKTNLTEGKPNWKIAEPGEADQPVSDHGRISATQE